MLPAIVEQFVVAESPISVMIRGENRRTPYGGVGDAHTNQTPIQ